TLRGTSLNGRGTSITIESDDKIEILGSVVAGNGLDADNIKSGTAQVAGNDGGVGGGITLRSKADITLGPAARLITGNGGAGADVIVTVETEANAEGKIFAKAGGGSPGGDVAIECDGTLRFTPGPESIIVLGNGGAGGNIWGEIAHDDELVTGLDLTGGAGGPSGFPSFAAGAIEGLTYEEIEENGGIVWVLKDDSVNLVVGGAGGDSGDASSTRPSFGAGSGDTDDGTAKRRRAAGVPAYPGKTLTHQGN
ncbi:unnamed protein product, partial [marine sediment metagenome]